MRPISSTSFFIASTSGLSSISASSSLKRVSMVRRSCETPASMAVRCSMRALDAALHLDEGLRRAPHLARAARPEVGDLAPLAEAFGGIGEPQNRPDLVAQEQHRHRDQHQRGAHHPSQKDVRVRDIGGTARREDPHHRVVELDADLEQCRAPDRIDPERPADLLSDLLRQRLIDQREERLRPRRRQLVDRQEIDHQPEFLLRDAAHLRVSAPAGRPCRPRSGWRCPAPLRRKAAA